jgi:hypothetical protein
MKKIDAKFTDMYGRKHRRYTVRSMGPGWGYAPLDKLYNIYLWPYGGTRKAAWDWLNLEEPAV